jgi:hypothetical protein
MPKVNELYLFKNQQEELINKSREAGYSKVPADQVFTAGINNKTERR